jgi:UDP-N-acetylmuramate dehydrogenase
VGVYEKQALVLVNHGGGTGVELLKLADALKQKVKETFGVSLTIEPIIYQ